MRKTPRIDAWRKRLSQILEPFGSKAELARFLADEYGGEQRVWQVRIQNFLTRQTPNGEHFSAISEWMDGR